MHWLLAWYPFYLGLKDHAHCDIPSAAANVALNLAFYLQNTRQSSCILKLLATPSGVGQQGGMVKGIAGAEAT